MAEEKKQESSSLTGALPVTVVLAMLAGLVFTHLSPYHEERPSVRPLQASYAAAQDVDARLWQDPFAAVDGASEEKPGSEGDTSFHTRNQIYYGDPVAIGDDFTVLAVTLPGGPYQEAAEDRMRRRYSVLSALANQGAVPQDEQHIGYFRPDRHSDIGLGLQKRVSFEWWSLPDDKKKVLLLWVDELSLLKYPATKLRELLCEASPRNSLKIIVPHYAVIGPNTSTLLRDMLKEVVEYVNNSAAVAECADKPGNYADKKTLGKIKEHPIVYYSAGATASDNRLLKETIGQTIDVETVSEYLRDQGVTLYRTTATDFAMMDILVDELEVRKVEKTDHVVILSEWDTFYGRAMPKAFKRAWGNGGKDSNGEKVVHEYGYMRGLDGKIPDKGEKAASVAEKKSGTKDKPETDALIEVPEGQSQKDYLRRIADNILELDQNLKDKDDPKHVAAIGVLGYDAHDKLMILEALRQYFPHKLFFTTDLDAAYVHPAKRPYTHNLLVASAFDLKLRDELQDKIPPFRDSYQTAFFLAVQMALKDEKCIADQIVLRHLGETLDEHFPDRLFINADPDAAYSHAANFLQTQNQLKAAAYDLNLLLNFQVKTPSFRDSYQVAKEGSCITDQIGIPLPRLFEIGRSRPVSLPILQDTVLPLHEDGGNKPECSWTNLPGCNSVQPRIFSTSQLHLTWGIIKAAVLLAILLPIISWWVREKVVQFMIGAVALPFLAYFLTRVFTTSQLHWIWGIGVGVILLSFVSRRIREKAVQFKLPLYAGLSVGVVLLLVYCHTPLWNNYIIHHYAEPFFWLEGVSIWPSQLLRLSIVLVAGVFFIWGRGEIKKMQDNLQAPRGGGTPSTFALPGEQAQLGNCDVLFVGSWKEDKEVGTVYPDDLWKKYLGYCRHKKIFFPGSFLRVFVHVVAFWLVAALLMKLSVTPNVPSRGNFAEGVNKVIIILAVLSTIFLTMWIVEHARLCERLIAHLSAKPSRWNNESRDWAIRENKVGPECVNDWLDIQLVVRLTKTIQPLIFGPVACIALLVLARSPAIDDWEIPWGLAMVLIAMLLYAISAEVRLQRGAKSARAKAIKQLTEKISAQRSLNRPNEVVIKRIEAEVERISALREGAFRPWYELPLLQSFGGLGTLVVALQYFYGVWESGNL